MMLYLTVKFDQERFVSIFATRCRYDTWHAKMTNSLIKTGCYLEIVGMVELVVKLSCELNLPGACLTKYR